MPAEIRPGAVIAQLDGKARMLDAASRECGERIRAISSFCADGTLSGEAWDAARARLAEHQVLYEGALQAIAAVQEADSALRSRIASDFGDVPRVSEREWLEKLEEARREAGWARARLADPVICGDAEFERCMEDLIRGWEQGERMAEEMLARISAYLACTDGLYARADSLLGILARGAASLSAAAFDRASLGWPASDRSWIGDLREGLGSGVASLGDLYDGGSGEIDDEALRAILSKPASLWTEAEMAAVLALYELVGERAVDGDTSLLERFLNDGYYAPEGIRLIDAADGSGQDMDYCCAEYEMEPGLAGFLALYDGLQRRAAFHADGPLGDGPRLLAAVASGLPERGRTFEVRAYTFFYAGEGVALRALAPDISIRYNAEEAVSDGKGGERTFVFTEVTYGNRPSLAGGISYRGGFIAMTGTADLNPQFSDLQGILAGRRYRDPAQAGIEAAGQSAAQSAAELLAGTAYDVAAKEHPLIFAAAEIGAAAGLDGAQAWADQSAVNASIGTVFDVADADTQAGYFRYGYGTVIADLDGSDVSLSSPGFANGADRECFVAAQRQFAYDNSNGTGTTYGSYIEWAQAAPEGGFVIIDDPNGTWSSREVITNFDIASHPDKLAWADPAPAAPREGGA